MNWFPSLDKLVKNPWFQLSSVAIGLLGIAVAVFLYIVTRRYKRIWYDVRSFTVVRRERSPGSPLRVLFADQPVEALTITKVALWNSGKDALRAEDFPEKEALRLTVANELEILEASIIQNTSEACNCRITRKAKSCFEIEFEFLDRRDGLVVQIAHTGTSSGDVKLLGRIVGSGKIVRREMGTSLGTAAVTSLLPKTRRGSRIFGMCVMAATGFLMIAMPALPPYHTGYPLLKAVPVILGLFYLRLPWLLYRNRPPKGLEKFEDEIGASESGYEPFKFAEAPIFPTRRDAAKWVIGQAQALAATTSAHFETKLVSDSEIVLDLAQFWLTTYQLNQIINLGQEHGIKVAIKGRGENPFIPREFYNENRKPKS